MRMLSVIDGLGYGGAERSLAELLPGMAAAGIEPVVACLHRRDGGVEADVLAGGFDVRFLPSGRAARLRAVRRLIRETSPSLVHTSLAAATLTGRFAAAGTRVPVLTSIVSQSYTPERLADPYLSPAAARAIWAIDGWSARHLTAHFHAITQAVKRSAAGTLRVPQARITVVERGRDPGRLGEPGPKRRARVRERLDLSPEATVIVAVGRQEFVKGHRFLFEAMSSVLSAHPSVVLLMAGRDGQETTRLHELAKASPLDRSVRFLGHRDDLPDILAASDLFVFPSLSEGLGMALVEAMALELPIVASALDPVREVVEDGRCAMLVPPRDPAALAAAVTSMLADPARARSLGKAGREIFLRRFTLERSTERMVALFRRVAREAASQHAPDDGVEVA